jgi:hypothetical protein
MLLCDLRPSGKCDVVVLLSLVLLGRYLEDRLQACKPLSLESCGLALASLSGRVV